MASPAQRVAGYLRPLGRMNTWRCTLLSLAVLGACAAPPGPLPVAPAPDITAARESCADVNRLVTKAPNYPRVALATLQSGWVLAGFDISADGTPLNVRVLESSPATMFDAAAIGTIQQWRFVSGHAKEGCRTVINFDIRKNAP